MPTQHIEPACAELLQDVANSLLKSRKVVVVTGAGISTNSGIPDFRSENGFYAMIQAQLDAASRRMHRSGSGSQEQSNEEDDDTDDRENGPPPKRRKTSSTGSDGESNAKADEVQVDLKVETVQTTTTITTEPTLPPPVVEEGTSITVDPSSFAITTPRPRRRPLSLEQLLTSPLSSPPPEDSIIPPSVFRSSRLTNMTFPLSSSPLSSPPPTLFDPFCPSSPSEDATSRRSSTSPSEVDDSEPLPHSLNAFSASQSSYSGKTSLPNMKGKDMFDASIWADPLRTSVFYTFTTTLRQKIRDVQPTSSHRFISHLRDRGKLVRCYTQNIDQIEEKVGLSTTLHHGPGSRGRFSRRSTATSQLNKMVEEVSGKDAESQSSDDPCLSQPSQDSTGDGTTTADSSQEKAEGPTKAPRGGKAELPKSGVECVFLHGSLEQLRCFLCGRVCSWDDEQREDETMFGQQPECPHCAGATAAREERGKRALGVGKLRPDIVLYGEEHPNAHLISPIVTHDLALCPDMLLILGTSLKVHGLKIMVREFAKAVHAKGGKVVFVNYTKPPESTWGDVLDYWVQWDCDAWVSDLQERIPKLWQAPEPLKPRKKKETGTAVEDGIERPEVKKPPPANPVALRDTKATGAYQTLRIVDELHRITGTPPRPRSASLAVNNIKAEVASDTSGEERANSKATRQPQSRNHRRSAPGILEQSKKLASSTLNPDHGRPQRTNKEESLDADPIPLATPGAERPSRAQEDADVVAQSSILDSVKRNARTRKRKKIDGVEVEMPTVGSRRKSAPTQVTVSEELKLAPMREDLSHLDRKPGGKLQVMEPRSPPPGPLSSISPNMRSARAFGVQHPFYLQDPLVQHGPTQPVDYDYTHGRENAPKPGLRISRGGGGQSHDQRGGQYPTKRAATTNTGEPPQKQLGGEVAENEAKSRFASVHQGRVATRKQLARWGSNWNCSQQ